VRGAGRAASVPRPGAHSSSRATAGTAEGVKRLAEFIFILFISTRCQAVASTVAVSLAADLLCPAAAGQCLRCVRVSEQE
jgi:hypothetical protein